MNHRAVQVWIAVSLVALLVLGGCRLASDLLGEDRVERPGLGAWNDTDITIELMLNGESLATIEPGTGMEIASRWRMPALPWDVEARGESGRVLLAMMVTAEDLASAGVKAAGADLPCGRLTMWAGTTPHSGPGGAVTPTGPCES